MGAKRVILRLRDHDFPDLSSEDLIACVESFLIFSGRPAEELEQGMHFWHVQPPNTDIPQKHPRFHIIIDLEKMEHSGPLRDDFPHEIYRVVPYEGKIRIIPFRKQQEHDNFVAKLRRFSDDFYPWGRQTERTVNETAPTLLVARDNCVSEFE